MIKDVSQLQQLESFADEFIKALKPGDVVFFHGDLGSGKTTFIQMIIKALGYQGRVKSPTYTLYDSYELGELTVFHMDLYRLASPEEIYYLGMEEIFNHENMVFIEWPEKGKGVLPPAAHHVYLRIIDENHRELELISA